MQQQSLVRGRRFHHAAVRREVSAQHGESRFARNRIGQRPNHVIEIDLRRCDVLAERLTGYRHRRKVERNGEPLHQRGQAAGEIEILHQVLARRQYVGQRGNSLRDRIEFVDGQRDSRTAREREQVDHGVGRAGHRGMDDHRVDERRLGQDRRRLQIGPDHVDDPRSGRRAHSHVIRIHRRQRRRARQAHAERLGNRRHRRGGAHDLTGPRRARDAGLHFIPVVLADRSGPQFGPVLHRVRADAQLRTAQVAAQHDAGRHIDRRQVHRQRAHQETRRRLVAAADQHRAVDRMLAQQFLGFERQQIPIQHRRRLDHHFAERERRQFDGKTAGLPDAPAHRVGALAQVEVARR